MPGSAHIHPSAPSADPNCTFEVTGSMYILQFKANVGVEWIWLQAAFQNKSIQPRAPNRRSSSSLLPGILRDILHTRSPLKPHFVLSSHKTSDCLQSCPTWTERRLQRIVPGSVKCMVMMLQPTHTGECGGGSGEQPPRGTYWSQDRRRTVTWWLLSLYFNIYEPVKGPSPFTGEIDKNHKLSIP